MSSLSIARPLTSYSAFLNDPKGKLYYILPTAEIIYQFKEFEELLAFYPGGLRGIVRDCILRADSDLITECSNRITETVVEDVVMEYENSADAVLQRFMENTSNATYVEVIAETIEIAIRDMLIPLFGLINYAVVPKTFQWKNDDIVILVQMDAPR